MKKGLLAILVFGAALCFGGYVAQAEEQHFMLDGDRIIAEIQAQAAIIEAHGYVNRCRAVVGPFWSEDESFPRTSVPAPLPVASSPRPRATVAPVASSPVLPSPPIAKPPVVAAPVEKPKVVEQAKVQAPVKPPQSSIAPSPSPTQTVKPAGTVQDDVKVCAMKVPLEKDTQIKGVLYRKGQPLWAIIRENNDGRIVDKDGRPTSDPELVSAPPRGAILVPFKTPQI